MHNINRKEPQIIFVIEFLRVGPQRTFFCTDWLCGWK